MNVKNFKITNVYRNNISLIIFYIITKEYKTKNFLMSSINVI
jgi:hypothetical protein